MNTFWKIMFFYAILSCFIVPFVFHYFTPTNSSYEHGYLLGTAISIGLWFMFGRKMIKN